MNKRIKELMKQSGAYDYYEINEGVNNDELPMAKFAELIVKECISKCVGMNQYKLGFELAKEFKEHFGVE